MVTAQALDVQTSSAEAQLIERKQASVITDNIGAQEMKNNGKVVDYDPDSKTAAPGDFRTEISSLVQKLNKDKVLAAEKKAKEWLKMFHKDDN